MKKATKKVSKKAVKKTLPRNKRLHTSVNEKTLRKITKKIGKKGVVSAYIRNLIVADLNQPKEVKTA